MKSHLPSRIFRKFQILQTAHPVPILLVSIALAAISIFYTIENLKFQTGQKDLISPKERLIQLAQEVHEFGQRDSFVVVIDSPSSPRSLQFLRALVGRLEKDRPNFPQLFYRVNPGDFRKWALRYLNTEDLRALTENVLDHASFLEGIAKEPTLVNFFDQLNREMASRMVGELFTGFLEDKRTAPTHGPLNLDFLIGTLKEMNGYLGGEGRFSSPWDALFASRAWGEGSEEGYFWTDNKKYLLLFITPAARADFVGTWQSLMALRKIVTGLRTNFPDIQAGVTGPEALNADQMNTALTDMGLATILSLFGLAGLFMIFWRGFRRPLLEISMLLVALAWCFGLITLVIGHLNILSVTFAPLLLGLGIDYGAHWFARYHEEEQTGLKTREAICSTMDKIGPGIVLAGFSLSLSFFPLALTGFKGLVELGLICFMGMIVMTVATLGLLPPLIIVFDKPISKRRPVPAANATSRPFFLMTRSRALALIIPGSIAFGVAAWQAGKVKFDLNMLDLQSQKVESVIWEKKLISESRHSSIYGEIPVPTIQEVREKTRMLETLPTVSRVESIASFLPHDQQAKAEVLKEMEPLLTKLGFLHPPDTPVDPVKLADVLGRIRFKMTQASSAEWKEKKPLESQMALVTELIDQTRRSLTGQDRAQVVKGLKSFERHFFRDLNEKLDLLRANVKSPPMRIKDLPPSLRERFLAANHLFVIRVYPKEDIWQPHNLGLFVHDLRRVSPDAVGDPVTLYIFTQAFRDSCVRAAFYAVMFIFALLALTLRNAKSTFLVLIPLLVGTVWTLGLMPVTRVDLNLANTLFLPLIVGAGVEYGVIIVTRWHRRDAREAPRPVLPRSTAMGVILAGLSTTVGFCSLTISSHQGIFSLGLLTTIGSLAVLIASVLFLPALMYLSQPGKGGGGNRKPKA